MRIGIIDLGSNTIRLVVYTWDGQSLLKTTNIKRQAQSAKYIVDGQMSKMGIETIIENLKELMMIARTKDVVELHIFATASVRNIQNSEAVKTQIEDAIQHKIDLLDAKEESIYGFEGLKRNIELPIEGVSVDVGGASTEITYFKHDKAIHTVSIPMGSLNTYINHVQEILPSNGEMMLMRIEIQNLLAQIDWLDKIEVETMFGIGGSARALMRVHQAKYDIQQSIYDMQMSYDILNQFMDSATEDPKALAEVIVNQVPERLTTLIPGSLILFELMKKIKAQSFRLSSYGVREGYFYQRVLDDVKAHQTK